MRIDHVKIGQKLRTWHDSGIGTAQPYYCDVLKVGKVKVFVKGENGETAWKYPASFDKVINNGI